MQEIYHAGEFANETHAVAEKIVHAGWNQIELESFTFENDSAHLEIHLRETDGSLTLVVTDKVEHETELHCDYGSKLDDALATIFTHQATLHIENFAPFLADLKVHFPDTFGFVDR